LRSVCGPADMLLRCCTGISIPIMISGCPESPGYLNVEKDLDMVGVLLVSHGQISKSFLDVATGILGHMEGVRAVCLPEPLDERKVLDEIGRARKLTDSGGGVLIITDMFGGTPSNLCFSLLEDSQVEVLTGMNLPMILKVLESRKEVGLADLAKIVLACGRENIYSGREILTPGTQGG